METATIEKRNTGVLSKEEFLKEFSTWIRFVQQVGVHFDTKKKYDLPNDIFVAVVKGLRENKDWARNLDTTKDVQLGGIAKKFSEVVVGVGKDVNNKNPLASSGEYGATDDQLYSMYVQCKKNTESNDTVAFSKVSRLLNKIYQLLNLLERLPDQKTEK
jgi:Tfp pilus assembly protein PilZ